VVGAAAFDLGPRCLDENLGNDPPLGLGEKFWWPRFWLKSAKVEVSITLAC
jgi:hypothetical protein